MIWRIERLASYCSPLAHINAAFWPPFTCNRIIWVMRYTSIRDFTPDSLPQHRITASDAAGSQHSSRPLANMPSVPGKPATIPHHAQSTHTVLRERATRLSCRQLGRSFAKHSYDMDDREKRHQDESDDQWQSGAMCPRHGRRVQKVQQNCLPGNDVVHK